MTSLRLTLAALGAAALLGACATSPAAGGAASAAAAAPAGFAYAPGSHRYRIVVSTVASQEMMGQRTTDSGTVTRIVSVALAPRAGDTLSVTYSVDSIATTTTNPQARDLIMAQKGRSASGTLSPLGAPYTFEAPTVDSAQAMMRMAMESYRNFFPRLPSRSVKAGDTWADTVTQQFANGGLTGSSRLVLTSRVVGDTTFAGSAALHVARTGEITITGSGSQGGQPLELEGQGTVNGSAYLATSGLYLGADESQSMDITVQAPAMSLTIPITQKITSRTELVR
jgi:hypothetical protein